MAIFTAKYLNDSSEKVIRNVSILFLSLILLISIAVIILPFIEISIEVDLFHALLVFFIFGISAVLFYKKYSNSNFLKPAYLGVIFIITVLMTSNHIFNKNESKINSVKPIAVFIKSQSNTKNNVLIYNYLLPSLSFYLDEEIITINHGKYTTQREVQFETNENWKQYLINYSDKEDRNRVLTYSSEKPIFLIKRKKDKLPDTLLILKNNLKHKKEFEKFEVYY